MSAHCHTCGSDLVYTRQWPEMECPVCTRDQRIDKLESVLKLANKTAKRRGEKIKALEKRLDCGGHHCGECLECVLTDRAVLRHAIEVLHASRR